MSFPASSSRRVLVRVAALALTLGLVAACGSDVKGKLVTEAGLACVQPKDIPPATGKPAPPSVPGRPATGQLITKDIKAGNGPEIVPGHTLKIEYYAISCTTGKQVFSTWDAAPAAPVPAPDPSAPSPTTAPAAPAGPTQVVFEAPAVVEGWLQGLKGMKVGGIRQLVVPAVLGKGAAGGPLPGGGTVAPDDTLLYVIQLDEVGGVPPACADAQVIDNGPDKKPTVNLVPGGDTPKALVKKDLRPGTGPAVKLGDKVSVQYVGLACSTAKQFDASWDRGMPFDTTLAKGQLIPGWTDGVPGMQAGGRRVLVIPPALAYGATGQGADIGPNETLYFVLDLVKIG